MKKCTVRSHTRAVYLKASSTRTARRSIITRASLQNNKEAYVNTV